ncbi:MAG: MerC domain-containing protein [Chitinophagaceae bacterium]
MFKKINWDALGITTSLACAIHCAILPLLVSSLPIFGINIIENSQFEYFMIVLAFIIGCFALLHGFRKHHHNILPLMVFTLGMLLLAAKQVFHGIHIWFLVPSVVLIVCAHYGNYKLSRRTGHIPIAGSEGQTG